MKNFLMLGLLSAAFVSPAVADYYKFQTNNCDPAAMHAELERAVREHRAVITEVTCDAVVNEPVVVETRQPVYVAPAPVYVGPSVDAGNIPVVDCVPGPIKCEYCANRY